MDPTGVGLLLGAWVLIGVVVAIGLGVFLSAAHAKEHALPEDAKGVREWIMPRAKSSSERQPPRAAA